MSNKIKITYYAEGRDNEGRLFRIKIPRKDIGFYWMRGFKIYRRINGKEKLIKR